MTPPLTRLHSVLVGTAVALFAGGALAEPESFSAALDRGPVYAALAAFGSGFLVSLTPCVYPMVAVTVSVFGAREVKGRMQGVLLSLAFVLGIVAMFVPLGVVAGLTGGVFGTVLSSPWVVGGICALFLVMAAAMFGAFELDLPDGLKNRLALLGGGGYPGAFVLGLVCGPIAAPCTGPFLTGILAWIAQTQSAVLGGLAMAAFALGLGTPFFLVGAFAVQLPKSGRWMLAVKSTLGLILVVVALYFLSTIFPSTAKLASPSRGFLVTTFVVTLVGLALGAVHKSFEDAALGTRISKGVGLLLTSGGAFLFVLGFSTPARSLSWEEVVASDGPRPMPAEAARKKALAEQRPLLLDFTAAWCAACKELSKVTFADERVAREAGRFVAVKVDATEDDDPVVVNDLSTFGVKGLPTVILFDSTGSERARFTEFVDAERFVAVLETIE